MADENNNSILGTSVQIDPNSGINQLQQDEQEATERLYANLGRRAIQLEALRQAADEFDQQPEGSFTRSMVMQDAAERGINLLQPLSDEQIITRGRNFWASKGRLSSDKTAFPKYECHVYGAAVRRNSPPARCEPA